MSEKVHSPRTFQDAAAVCAENGGHVCTYDEYAEFCAFSKEFGGDGSFDPFKGHCPSLSSGVTRTETYPCLKEVDVHYTKDCSYNQNTIVEQSSIAVVTEIVQDMEEAATLETFLVVEIQEQRLDT